MSLNENFIAVSQLHMCLEISWNISKDQINALHSVTLCSTFVVNPREFPDKSTAWYTGTSLIQMKFTLI